MDFEGNYKKFLKDSGCNDENMSQEEMIQYQAAINNSKDTATQETVMRSFSEDFAMDKPPSTSEDKPYRNVTLRSRTESPLDLFLSEFEKQEFPITFQDLVKPSEESLKIIYHTPIYELPIPTNPKYVKYSVKEKVKLLDAYHSRIGELQLSLYRKSLLRAPYSRPILPSVKCKSSLLKDADDEEVEKPPDEESWFTEQLYTSRAGRKIKRKVYTEDVEIDNSDNEFETSSKRNKTFDTDLKITLDNPYIPEDSEEKSQQNTVKTKKDTPKRTPFTAKKGRSNLLVEMAVDGNTKTRQNQKEVSDFMKSLSPLREDEEEMIIDDSPVKDEENFIRRRVVPPSRINSRAKKQESQEDIDNDLIPSSPFGSPVLKKYTNVKTSQRLHNLKGNTPSEQTQILKANCPICGGTFLQSEIVNHAASCGIDDLPGSSNQSEVPEEKMFICELCKEECARADFEAHYKLCVNQL